MIMMIFFQMLPIEITTERNCEPDYMTSPESNDEAAQTDGNILSQEDSGNIEDNKESEDKGPVQSPPTQVVPELWKPRVGLGKRAPGFQAELCCVCEMTGAVVPLCYLTMSSAFGM